MKKMKNVEAAFKFSDNGSKLRIRYKMITFHLIYDVNFDITRKTR